MRLTIVNENQGHELTMKIIDRKTNALRNVFNNKLEKKMRKWGGNEGYKKGLSQISFVENLGVLKTLRAHTQL
jgi:hypothetical protein